MTMGLSNFNSISLPIVNIVSFVLLLDSLPSFSILNIFAHTDTVNTLHIFEKDKLSTFAFKL